MEKEFTTVKVYEKSLNSIKDQTYSLNSSTPLFRHSLEFRLPKPFVFVKDPCISPQVFQNGLPASIKAELINKNTIRIQRYSDNHIYIDINDWILPGIILQLNWQNLSHQKRAIDTK